MSESVTRGAISHEVVRTPDWFSIKLLAPEVAAVSLCSILRSLDSIEEQAFAVRGEAMMLIEERNLYRFILDQEVGDYYVSMDKWLKDTLPRSWGYARDALRARKECKDVPFADFSHMKRCNIEQLKKVSSNVRLLPDVVQAAKSMPEKAFVEKLNQEHQQHLSTNTPVVMAPEDVHAKLDEAIEMATQLFGCKSRGEALEAIACDFLLTHADEVEHQSEATA